MVYRKLLTLVFLLTFNSCQKERSKKHISEKKTIDTYYPDGSIKFRFYEKNNIPVDSFFSYYRNGVLSSKGFFRDGELEGRSLSFYENGILKNTVNYQEGELYGEALFYSIDGVLEEYSVYWNDSSKGYSREYDTTGLVIRDDGPAICHMKTDIKEDSFVFKMPYARPPSTDTKIEAKLFFKGKKIENKLVDLSGEIGVLKTDNKVDSIVFIAEIMSLPAYNVFKSDTIIHAGF